MTIGPGARTTDPETSHIAAAMNPGLRRSQRVRILGAFVRVYPEGLTADEAADMVDVVGGWKRVSELKEMELLEHRGETRLNKSKAPAEIWYATGDGTTAYFAVQVGEI